MASNAFKERFCPSRAWGIHACCHKHGPRADKICGVNFFSNNLFFKHYRSKERGKIPALCRGNKRAFFDFGFVFWLTIYGPRTADPF